MKRYLFIIIVLTTFLVSCGNSKMFPRKYIGDFYGLQEEYEVEIEGQTIKVPEVDFNVTLNYGKLLLRSPLQNIDAYFTIATETKLYYSLKVSFENGIVEEWQLWKEGKRLIRKGNPPKPEVIFVKR